MGTASEVRVYFKYGTTWNQTIYPLWLGGNVTQSQVLGVPGEFSANITSLNPGTTYYFKAIAKGEGSAYGYTMTFITPLPATE